MKALNLFGKGKDLRGQRTFVVSEIANAVPEEDTIRVNYLINDEILVEHSNPKSENERPVIILIISFLNNEIV
jgi:hypothetical protein